MKISRLRNGKIIAHTRSELLRYIVDIHNEKSRAVSIAVLLTEWAVIAYEELTGVELGWQRLCAIDTDRWKAGVYRRQRERKHKQWDQMCVEFERAQNIRKITQRKEER